VVFRQIWKLLAELLRRKSRVYYPSIAMKTLFSLFIAALFSGFAIGEQRQGLQDQLEAALVDADFVCVVLANGSQRLLQPGYSGLLVMVDQPFNDTGRDYLYSKTTVVDEQTGIKTYQHKWFGIVDEHVIIPPAGGHSAWGAYPLKELESLYYSGMEIGGMLMNVHLWEGGEVEFLFIEYVSRS